MKISPNPDKNFTVIQNDIFDNYPEMTAKAKFMFLQILRRPDDWNMNVKWLSKQNAEGIHAVRSSVKEWENNNFLHRVIVREDGRIKDIENVICYPPLSREEAERIFKARMENPGKKEEWPNRQDELPLVNSPEFSRDSYPKMDRFEIIQDTEKTPSPNLGQPKIHPKIDTSPLEATKIKPTTVSTDKKTLHKEKLRSGNHTLINTDILINTERNNDDNDARACEADNRCEMTPPLPSSYPATSDVNNLLDLIPERFRTPMTDNVVTNALKSFSPDRITDAILYSVDNVNGGHMQFKAYLDKAIHGGWGNGYGLTKEVPVIRVHRQNPFERQYGELYPNGTMTGSKRSDSNLAACVAFAMSAERGEI